jgi:nucleoside-diphosphate-sugar epimerase
VVPLIENCSRTVLVTGANGFVGTALCAALRTAGFGVRGVVREKDRNDPALIEVGSFGPRTEWEPLLTGVDCVVHLAARTHHVSDRGMEALELYRASNVEPAVRLAHAAVTCGVRRLIYLSSIKVNGEATENPYTELDVPKPEDSYGLSKWETEQALTGIAAGTSLELVILRPPLVYGAGVKGNYFRLMKCVANGIPLPIGSVRNLRSMVYVKNLAHAIVTCIDAPKAANRVYLVCDDEALSTPDLVRMNAAALGVKPRIYPSPVSLVRMATRIVGKSAEFKRIASSLVIDNARIKSETGWSPPVTCEQGIFETALWYVTHVGVGQRLN